MGSVLSTSVFAYTFALATLKHTGAFRKDSDFEDNILGCGITAITTCGATAIATIACAATATAPAISVSVPIVIAINALYAYTPEIVSRLQ